MGGVVLGLTDVNGRPPNKERMRKAIAHGNGNPGNKG